MNDTLVFGASGQLGHCIKLVSKEMGMLNILFPDEKFANILDTNLLEELFAKERPSFVINCAAYTAVDKAEDEIELARRINKDGAANLAMLCNKYNATLIHVSTDFVFEGNQASPLTETDIAEPINVYGLTKLEGEKSIANTLDRYFILRTSWLYSEFGNNFVKTMLKLGQDSPSLNIISDQIGTPTYAIDLASCILNIIESKNTSYGLYHYSNEGVTSWYDFAKAIFDIRNMPVKVLPITSQEYVTKAKRPAFSVMDKSKIKQMMNIEIPYWRDSLGKCLVNLEAKHKMSVTS